MIQDVLLSVAEKKLKRQWGGYYSREPLIAWCGKNKSVFEMLEDETLERAEYQKERNRVLRELFSVGELHCRKVKASSEGYSVDDEYFYGLFLLEELLSQYYQSGVSAYPLQSYGSSVVKRGNPSEGGGFLTSMVDVSRGLSLVPSRHRRLLALRYGICGGMSDREVCELAQSTIRDLTGWGPLRWTELVGRTPEETTRRTQNALRALQRVLGGLSPSRGW